ncbi:DsbA family protein [Miltoncostaea oceani]|uniref:DsbA family protein n=1 Tax=Miltoncostaea oceani TaxID=2843216 RepID=UPI001C3D270E|nr:thioredoxin domain-containing protein [Miltoncostaea oceani]
MVLGALALIVTAALVAVSFSAREQGLDPAALQGLDGIPARYADIPASGVVLGDPDAPVSITEFGDVACPACKTAAESTVPDLIESQVRTGLATISFSPMAFIHPLTSERGALAVIAAGRQDMAWPMIEAIYANQGGESEDWLSEEVLAAIAAGAGLDVATWQADFASDEVARDYAAAIQAANAGGVSQTPTFIVEGPDGREVVSGVSSAAQIAEAVRAVS